MKKLLFVALDFSLKLLFIVVAGFYVLSLYLHFINSDFYAFDVRILVINFACVSAVLLIWAAAQKMQWRLVAEQTKLSKKTNRMFSLLFAACAALFVLWLVAYPIIFSRTKIFGQYIVFDHRLMFATCMFWAVSWLIAVLFSSLKTPARLAFGYILTGLCGSLGNIEYYAYTNDRDIADHMQKLFSHHLVPLYLGAVLFFACFFILKGVCTRRVLDVAIN